jgi:hypothetical protein
MKRKRPGNTGRGADMRAEMSTTLANRKWRIDPGTSLYLVRASDITSSVRTVPEISR